MDVTALYTNIPTDSFITASQHFLSQKHSTTEVEVLTKFTELTVTQNNFEFAGRHYIQVLATARSTSMAPSGACLFMGRLEVHFLSDATMKPLIWMRYIDDIFLIWTHGQEELQNFIAFCNSRHPNIKFTSDQSRNSVAFLDVTVSLVDGFLKNIPLLQTTRISYGPLVTRSIPNAASLAVLHTYYAVFALQTRHLPSELNI